MKLKWAMNKNGSTEVMVNEMKKIRPIGQWTGHPRKKGVSDAREWDESST